MTATDFLDDGPGLSGLSAAEVEDRRSRGLVNRVEERTSRRVVDIWRAHVLTRFNALLGAVGAGVLITGRWQDALFLIVLVVNAAVGIVQELRAKRTLDSLAVLHAPRALVRRDGEEVEIDPAEIVLDDLVIVRAGDQIVVDATVVTSGELEIDESLLTGEAEAVAKAPRDPLLSGSIVVAGRGVAVATAVGAQSYAHRLAIEARRFTLTASELRRGTDLILTWISWVVVVLGPLLVLSQWGRSDTWQDAVTSAAAGVVGMVPEGLVLLTTLAFVVAVIGLARRDVLVQELAAVEGLARVDVVCVDKTGTLTHGSMKVAETILGDEVDRDELRLALGALAHSPSPNSTSTALAEGFDPPEPAADGEWRRGFEVPFSSARKWSAVTLEGHGTWYLGAPDVLEAAMPDPGPLVTRAAEFADAGRRVVAVAHRHTPVDETFLDLARPDQGGLDQARMVALVVLDEQIRDDAADTLAYFADQGVTVKVISGDHPRTVASVARRVGLADLDTPGAIVDARGLPEDLDELAEILDSAVVLGRVAPHQKQAMVAALQARGHVVAMTGDGVNDALALKTADLGVAMGSGAPASRAVAQLVLLDGRFAHLPRVVAEGRRVIANVERVATLFVMKNVMSALLSIVTILGLVTYPLLPRHMSVLSTLTIGIPAFVLALAPNPRRYRPGFVQRVLRHAIPFGVMMAAVAILGFTVARDDTPVTDEARAATLVATVMVGLGVLIIVARPVRWWKVFLVLSMALVFAAAMAIPVTRDLFALDLSGFGLTTGLGIGAVGSLLAVGLARRIDMRPTS